MSAFIDRVYSLHCPTNPPRSGGVEPRGIGRRPATLGGGIPGPQQNDRRRYILLMNRTYLVDRHLLGGHLRDARAAIDLVKEKGGFVVGFFPGVFSAPAGVLVECRPETAEALGLVPWS